MTGEYTYAKMGDNPRSSTIPNPTGLRNVGAKSEAIIGVGGSNRPSYLNVFGKRPVRTRCRVLWGPGV